MRRIIAVMTLLVGTVAGGYSSSLAASCSASNDVGDTCSIDCQQGQAAECQNASGGGRPVCECSGSVELNGTFLPTDMSLMNTMQAATSTGKLETDVLSVVNARLAQLRDYIVSRSEYQVVVGQWCRPPRKLPCDVGGAIMSTPAADDARIPPEDDGHIGPQCYEQQCYDKYETRYKDVLGKLTSNGSFQVEVRPVVKVEEPNWQDIPTMYFGLRATYLNCSTERQEYGFNHSFRSKVGTRVVKTKTVKNSQDVSAEVSFSFVVNGKIGAKFSKEISVSDQSDVSEEREENLAFSQKINVGPMQEMIYHHEFAQRVVDVPYSGTVQLNGGVSQNFENITSLAQVLPNAADRTFEFAGVVSDTSLYGDVTKNLTRKLTEKECAEHFSKAGGGVIPPSFEPYTRISSGKDQGVMQ